VAARASFWANFTPLANGRGSCYGLGLRSDHPENMGFMRVVFWGTYDLGKPRTRILLSGLRETDVEVVECHADVWAGIEDKSGVSRWTDRLRIWVRWLSSYPGLLFRYLRLPRHDIVFIGFPGYLDVVVLWPFAKLRRVPIVWDAFMSLYDTLVGDRKMLGPRHPVALFLFGLDWLACRMADRVVLDTRAHANYFEKTFRIPSARTAVVFVGAEPDAFPPRPVGAPPKPADAPVTVLFFGQFIPLHGIETVVRAAQRANAEPIEWVLIGRGQEEAKIRHMLEKGRVKRLELNEWIHRADVCLGIFGGSGKAARVIPNKVFQALSAGAPVITRDSPAIRELLSDRMAGVFLVPPEDPDALACAVRLFAEGRDALAGKTLHEEVRARIGPKAVAATLGEIMASLTGRDRAALRGTRTH
jgi:glycosyltransferase involved in cell wall biosynthesis